MSDDSKLSFFQRMSNVDADGNPAPAGRESTPRNNKRKRKTLDLDMLRPKVRRGDKKEAPKRKAVAKADEEAYVEEEQDNDDNDDEAYVEEEEEEKQQQQQDKADNEADNVKVQDVVSTIKKASHWTDQSGWMQQYNKLIEYKKEHGNCEVPQRYKKDPALGRWCKKQREHYKKFVNNKKGSITQERIDLLNKINFAWIAQKTKRTVIKEFDVHLEEMKEYKRIHGHTRVPHVYEPNPGLGVFCHRAKIFYREIQEGKRKAPSDWLTPKRIQALNDIEFEWKVGRWKDGLTWDERFSQLVDFVDKYGHCNVTKEYDEQHAPGLKVWVYNQRAYLTRDPRDKRFKNAKRIKNAVALSQEKITALKSLGVEFGRMENDSESGDET